MMITVDNECDEYGRPVVGNYFAMGPYINLEWCGRPFGNWYLPSKVV